MYNSSFDPERYTQQQMQEYFRDCRDVQKSIAKAQALEDIRLKGLADRQLLRQLEAERKRATFDELTITPEGHVQLITRNLTVDARPRSLTNMKAPCVVILRRLADSSDEIFLYKCIVNNLPRKLFLDPHKAGKGSYLLRNFALIGGYFQLPQTKAKDLSVQLLAFLIASDSKEQILPDEEGYVEMPGKGLIYVGKDDLTWKKAMRSVH